MDIAINRARRHQCKMYYLDSTECRYCDTPFGVHGQRTRDHIIPLSRGGKGGYPNKAVSCNACNNAKASMLPSEFIKVIYEHYNLKKNYKNISVDVMPNIIRNLTYCFIPKETDPQYLSASAKKIFLSNVETTN